MSTGGVNQPVGVMSLELWREVWAKVIKLGVCIQMILKPEMDAIGQGESCIEHKGKGP